MKERETVLMAALLVLAGAAPAGAESLWEHREERSAYLYRDRAARAEGDTVTILVEEQTSFQEQGERQLQKGSSASAQASASAGGDEWFTPVDVSEDSSRQFQGSSSYTRSRSFEDSISASVIDVLPNGHLVVAGRSERDVAGERAITTVTGVVNPDDIAGGNTVSSRRVSHLELNYETEGVSNRFLRMGFLNRIFNYLWPF